MSAPHPEKALFLLNGCHVRILRTDGKEIQGTVITTNSVLVWLEQPGATKIVPWSSISVMNVGDKDCSTPPYAAPRSTETGDSTEREV